MKKLRAIYRDTESNNLFWMTSDQVQFRNSISAGGKFEFISYGCVVKKSREIAPNGHSCVIIEAENGKKYRRYNDYSLSEM